MTDGQTDQDRITDHPFVAGRPPLDPDECGYDDGLPCGYGQDEHADKGRQP